MGGNGRTKLTFGMGIASVMDSSDRSSIMFLMRMERSAMSLSEAFGQPNRPAKAGY